MEPVSHHHLVCNLFWCVLSARLHQTAHAMEPGLVLFTDVSQCPAPKRDLNRSMNILLAPFSQMAANSAHHSAPRLPRSTPFQVHLCQYVLISFTFLISPIECASVMKMLPNWRDLSPSDGHLGCSQSLSITNRNAMNVVAQTSLSPGFSTHRTFSTGGTAGSEVALLLWVDTAWLGHECPERNHCSHRLAIWFLGSTEPQEWWGEWLHTAPASGNLSCWPLQSPTVHSLHANLLHLY